MTIRQVLLLRGTYGQYVCGPPLLLCCLCYCAAAAAADIQFIY